MFRSSRHGRSSGGLLPGCSRPAPLRLASASGLRARCGCLCGRSGRRGGCRLWCWRRRRRRRLGRGFFVDGLSHPVQAPAHLGPGLLEGPLAGVYRFHQQVAALLNAPGVRAFLKFHAFCLQKLSHVPVQFVLVDFVHKRFPFRRYFPRVHRDRQLHVRAGFVGSSAPSPSSGPRWPGFRFQDRAAALAASLNCLRRPTLLRGRGGSWSADRTLFRKPPVTP